MKNHPPTPADVPLLTVVDVARIFQIGQRTVYDWVSRGRLPAPIKLSPWVMRWRREDIEKLARGETARTA